MVDDPNGTRNLKQSVKVILMDKLALPSAEIRPSRLISRKTALFTAKRAEVTSFRSHCACCRLTFFFVCRHLPTAQGELLSLGYGAPGGDFCTYIARKYAIVLRPIGPEMFFRAVQFDKKNFQLLLFAHQ
jgi:hypothetical protein